MVSHVAVGIQLGFGLFIDAYRHAGMPNHTDETRIMLAFVYFAK